MLCPEVWNFPPPKTYSSIQKTRSLSSIQKIVNCNNFYRSVIITCPDELKTPDNIEATLEDSDYYKLYNCSLCEFLEPVFIKSFVKCGSIFCLSSNRNCVVENCACITPDGVLYLHILEFIYQTLGLEGKKVPHNFYEVKIDLLNVKNLNKIKKALNKLEKFDFYVSWEPETDNVCPSSIAKYFSEKNLHVTCHALEIQRITPDINKIPSIMDTEIDEVVEWIGMLAHNADISPTEGYISMYTEPDSASPINSNRISLLIVRGFLTPRLISNLCQEMLCYVKERELENHWTCLSIQSIEDSLWRWNASSPSIFQSHDNSTNIFFTSQEQTVYSIGQLKYS